MASANIKFRDSLISHQIALMRLSGSVNQRIMQILDATEKELRDQIKRALESMTDRADVTAPATVRRLKALADSIEELRGKAVDDSLDYWMDQMRQLAVAEPAFTDSKLKDALPIVLDTVLPAPALLRALVNTDPFMGQTLKQWASQLASDDLNRIMNEIRIGMVQGQGIPEIAARVVGNVQYHGKNGATEITRRDATSITRTAVNFFSNQARAEFFAANSNLFTQEIYIAVLDSRTTPICRSLDGKKFDVGQGPEPPLHWGCRSSRAAVITDEVIGTRPMIPATEKMLLKEFTEENNLESVSNRDDLPHGTKGQFDEFARKRLRQLIGPVPAKTTYAEFLKRQSNEFQDEVLGQTKAILFRKGGLTLDRYVDRAGNELTLRQLVIRDRGAFIRAGLNPDNYL